MAGFLLALAPLPAWGQAAPAPAAPKAAPRAAPPTAAPLPGNTVRCVYEYLSPEDREIALLLLGREMIDGGNFTDASKNIQVVNRLLAEAEAKCLDRFNWSIGRSKSATNWALTQILSEALVQALDYAGSKPADVDAYYAENRPLLRGKRAIEGADKEALNAYLIEKGWDAESKAQLGLAAIYLETYVMKDSDERWFQYSGGSTRQPSPRSPSRAKKGRRGRP